MNLVQIVTPTFDAMASAGYAHLASLPFIMSTDGTRYDNDANEFLFERCFGYWPKRLGPPSAPATAATQRTYANALANFIEYAQARQIDLRHADYNLHIYSRYQAEMVAGTWSLSGQGLSERTVNARVDRACEFLMWLAEKGRRPAFVFAQTKRLEPEATAIKQTKVRNGRLRERPFNIRLPTREQMDRWLDDCGTRYGEEVRLCFELVLDTAIRKSELVGWRLDTIPFDEGDWNIVNPGSPPADQKIQVTIRYGTKGKAYGMDCGDKIGPARDILISVNMARRLNAYRQSMRRKSLALILKGKARGKLLERLSEPHLFLDHRTGFAISANRITNCWRKGGALPFKGWSPHGGRRWWACTTLLRSMEGRRGLAAAGAMGSQGPWDLANDIIRLEIQPQLGHMDVKTVTTYVRWAVRRLGAQLPTTYSDDLEKGKS